MGEFFNQDKSGARIHNEYLNFSYNEALLYHIKV